MNTQSEILSDLLTPKGFEQFLNERDASLDADHCARVVLLEMGFDEAATGREMLVAFFNALSAATQDEKAQLERAYPVHILAICLSLLGFLETDEEQAEAYRLMADDFPALFEILNEQFATHFTAWVEMGRRYGATDLPTFH